LIRTLKISENKINEKKIIILTGPTSSGKTTISIELAKRYKTEIVSADSMHVYKKFDIGTGKPPKNIMSEIRHHLVDIIEPDQDFNAWEYMQIAREVIDLSSKDKLIISGGTQLYIKALVDGLISDLSKNELDRNKLLEELNSNGIEHMYNKLRDIDPVQAKKISSNDSQRIIRFLEINQLTGRLPSELFAEEEQIPLKDCEIIKVGLLISKSKLDELINARVDEMISEGLFDEVDALIESFGYNIKPLGSIGYKEICSYFKGDFTKDEAIEKIKTNTRRFAKRQLTWLKKDKEMIWFKNKEDLIKYCDCFTSN
tara:strand:+ start:895 stop:1836 length:942 start_codon:yes stop_codon:yes gene_type:complete